MKISNTSLFKIRERTNIELIGLVKTLEVENTILRKELNKVIANQKRKENMREYDSKRRGRKRWKDK